MLKRNVIIISVVLIAVFLLFLVLILTGNCCFKDRCQIPIKILENTPIFFSKDGKFVYPQDDSIVIDRDLSINIACPGSQLSSGSVWAQMTCITETTFVLFNDNVDVTTLYCKEQIKSIARYTGLSCENSGSEIEVGFDLGNEIFLKQMRICFDKNQRTTFYTEHNLTSVINNQELSGKRPYFEEGNFFNISGKLSDLYTRNVQRQTINKQLGIKYANSTEVIKNGSLYFLSRGHLAPKADFFYASQQNASFYYVNAAPQWQIINARAWNTLEWRIRSYVTKRGSDLRIITGTYDKLILSNYSSFQLHLYYNPPSVGVPVPKLFWKIVYDPLIKKGVAFVGTNNPYLKENDVNFICKDVSNSINWIKFNNKNMTNGIIYACDVDEFRNVVQNVPKLEVTGLLVQ